MQRHKVAFWSHTDESRGVSIRQVPAEKFSYFIASEKELEGSDKEKKIQQLRSITGEGIKQFFQGWKLVCPIYSCFKEFKVTEGLKVHLE